MGLRFWLFMAIAGGLAHLVLYFADREIDASINRLAEVRLADRQVADPELKLVSARGRYMRDERE
jgi:hypothetical protein